MKREYICRKSCSLDDFLKNDCKISRRMITRLKGIENGITVNGMHAKTTQILQVGDKVLITLSDELGLEPNPDLAVEIVFKNSSVIVFNKPANMPCHPSIGHYSDTLGNFFASIYPQKAFRPINRLDRDTSGLCVCALDAISAASLTGNIEKTYYAVVGGEIKESGTVDAPIARESESIIKRRVAENGQRAVTNYTPICTKNGKTLLKISLETGRTHQIRVHMSHIGHPLCGDSMYGGDSSCPRQALHCGEVSFKDPESDEILHFCSKMPSDIDVERI